MKILHLIPRFTAGGAEQLVLAHVKYLSELGVKVAVGSVVGGGELEEKFREKGIEIVVAPKRRFYRLLRVWFDLKKWVKNFAPDIVHTHVFGADFNGYLLKKTLGVKWVSTQHNVEANAPIWRKLVWKKILRSADKVIAVSDSVYDFCLREWRLPKDKIVLIKNGIELEPWFMVSAVEPFAVRLRSLQAAPQLRLATIGRLEKQKGHEILLRALAQLKIDWHLDVFGDGSLFRELQSLSRKLNIENKIAWRGVVLDLAGELNKIDVVVQPSLWEGMSLVVMEAMASGRVVVASEPAATGLIQDNKTGIVVKLSDVHALTQAIESVASDRAHARSLAVSARNHAQEHFGIEKNISSLEELYESIEN